MKMSILRTEWPIVQIREIIFILIAGRSLIGSSKDLGGENEQNILIDVCWARYTGICARSGDAETTGRRKTGARFQSYDRRWLAGKDRKSTRLNSSHPSIS